MTPPNLRLLPLRIRGFTKKKLPTRHVAALLFANVKDKLEPDWHWTVDELDASCAWGCDFDFGLQYNLRKSYDGCAVAVRLIPLTV